jgi:tetratricopeptide (TPR) repeat protein
LSFDPDNEEYFANRGAANYGGLAFDESIKDYDKSIEINPSKSAYYYHRGLSKLALGILGDFEEGKGNPNNNLYSVPKKEFEFFNLSINDSTHAINLNPTESQFYQSRGEANYRLPDLEKAIEDYDKAIELNTEKAELYLSRGAIRRKQGNLVSASEDFNKAIALRPGFGPLSKYL